MRVRGLYPKKVTISDVSRIKRWSRQHKKVSPILNEDFKFENDSVFRVHIER